MNLVRIRTDYQNRLLRVEVNSAPPGWAPIWTEVAALASAEEEETCMVEVNGQAMTVRNLFERLSDDDLDTVSWFWQDMGGLR